MKKNDVIARFAEDYEIPKKVATGMYNTLVDMISEALASEEVVDLQDFCRITIRHTKARKGRNPFTGEQIKIKAKKKINFRPKPSLKRIVSDG